MLGGVRRRWIARALPMGAILLLLLGGWAGGELQHLRHHLNGCADDRPHDTPPGPWDGHGVCVACQAFHHGWMDVAPSVELAAVHAAREAAVLPLDAPLLRLDAALPSARGPPPAPAR